MAAVTRGEGAVAGAKKANGREMRLIMTCSQFRLTSRKKREPSLHSQSVSAANKSTGNSGPNNHWNLL